MRNNFFKAQKSLKRLEMHLICNKLSVKIKINRITKPSLALKMLQFFEIFFDNWEKLLLKRQNSSIKLLNLN